MRGGARPCCQGSSPLPLRPSIPGIASSSPELRPRSCRQPLTSKYNPKAHDTPPQYQGPWPQRVEKLPWDTAKESFSTLKRLRPLPSPPNASHCITSTSHLPSSVLIHVIRELRGQFIRFCGFPSRNPWTTQCAGTPRPRFDEEKTFPCCSIPSSRDRQTHTRTARACILPGFPSTLRK